MPDFAARQAKLRALLSEADAVALVPGSNLRYFTGLDFHISERPTVAVFTADGLSLIVPELEMPRILARPDLEARPFIWNDREGYQAAFADLVKTLGLKTLAIDGLTMRAFEMMTLQDGAAQAHSRLRIENVAAGLLSIRAIKEAEEVAAMRQAARISEAALDQVLAWVQPGVSEEAICRRLSEEMQALGAYQLAFEPLVQSGPNSALPHGNSGARALQEDEFLLIDWGAKYHEYPADLTRTFCLGTATAEMQRIYDTVRRANEAGIAAAAPGVACEAVDSAARRVIADAGYGQYFIHRTGHGLGVDTHELPQIAAGVSAPLLPGMVFTVEPGIYIPGLGGVRIEDNVHITESGADVLSSYRKSLAVR
ncbi:MAG: aminopeptidase P family protein [Chloroflexi bacterium]|nr:aminopeptidase P family protein [Chloroflexota bacterium]